MKLALAHHDQSISTTSGNNSCIGTRILAAFPCIAGACDTRSWRDAVHLDRTGFDNRSRRFPTLRNAYLVVHFARFFIPVDHCDHSRLAIHDSPACIRQRILVVLHRIYRCGRRYIERQRVLEQRDCLRNIDHLTVDHVSSWSIRWTRWLNVDDDEVRGWQLNGTNKEPERLSVEQLSQLFADGDE